MGTPFTASGYYYKSPVQSQTSERTYTGVSTKMEWYWQKNRQKGKEKRTQEYPSINTLANGLLVIGGLVCGCSTKHSARMAQPQ